MKAPDILEQPQLNIEEFFTLIPHLELEELLMTQIHKNGSWNFLFEASFYKTNQISTLTCVACEELVDHEKFNIHLKLNSHELAMKNVKKFFHPYYMNKEDYGNLGMGTAAFENSSENTEEQDNSSPYADSITISKSKQIAQCIREFSGDLRLDRYIDPVLKTVLTKDVMKPEDLMVEVKLPLEDLLNVEFCVEKDKWMRMVTVNKTADTKFYCALCSKFCFGIVTVENHLKGYTHKKAQIGCIGVRCARYKNLTKNCIYGYSENFAIKTKKEFPKLFNNEDKQRTDEAFEQNQIENLNDARSLNVEIKPTLPASIAEKVKNIKEKIHSQSKDNVEGLIGVEYVIKILKSPTDKFPMYECCLCEIVLNENRMQGHLTGYNHRLKYCELHYPNTIEKFKDLIGHVKYVDYFNAMNYALSKIASAIEQHHGRSTPYVVSSSTFTKMRSGLIAEIYSYPNACQQHGPSFTNIINEKEIKSVATGQAEHIVQTNNRARFIENPEEKLYLYRRCHDPNLRNDENFISIRKRKRSKSPTFNKKYSKSILRPRLLSVSTKKTKKQYSQNVDNSVNIYPHNEDEVNIFKIERMYKEYRKNPESHPLYDEEWNEFWRQRKEQLISQRIDHRSYNYQPEWVKYFKTRLEELYEKELYDSRMEVRERFCKYENKSSTIDKLPNKSDNGSRFSHLDETKDVADDKPTIIHVLRLLTALEDYLGSLGCKVMDLLSKALMIEKNCSNNIELEQKILTYENCTVLETAVEKLKGILFAGLLDASKLQGFNRIIQYTSDLLKYADGMGWRSLQPGFRNRNDKLDYQKVTNDATQNVKTPANQKTLSDTLMDLLSMQKNNNESILTRTNNAMKTYSNGRRETPNSEVGQYFINTQPKNSYWQTLGSNTSIFLNKPPFFERNLNRSSTSNSHNTNKAYNQAEIAYNHPSMFPAMEITANRPNYNYNPMGGVNNF